MCKSRNKLSNNGRPIGKQRLNKQKVTINFIFSLKIFQVAQRNLRFLVPFFKKIPKGTKDMIMGLPWESWKNRLRDTVIIVFSILMYTILARD